MSSFIKTQEEVKKTREEKVKQMKIDVAVSIMNGMLSNSLFWSKGSPQPAISAEQIDLATTTSLEVANQLLDKVGLLKKSEV